MSVLDTYRRNPWSILDELETLQEDMNRAFAGWAPARTHGAARRSYPPVNVWSSPEGVIVDAEIPGANADDVDISVEADQMVIRGRINLQEPKEGETWHRRERAYGEFVRTLQLPFRADAEGVKAVYKKGILRITVPRSEEDRPRKIAIEAG